MSYKKGEFFMAGMKSNMTVLDQVKERDEIVGSCPEKMLGRGLIQPFNVSNSGPRKLLASSQSDQFVPIWSLCSIFVSSL